MYKRLIILFFSCLLFVSVYGNTRHPFRESIQYLAKGSASGYYTIDDEFIILHFDDSRLDYVMDPTRKLGFTFGITRDKDFRDRNEYIEGEEIAFVGYFERGSVVNLGGKTVRISRSELSDSELGRYRIYIMSQSGSTPFMQRLIFRDRLEVQ